jgi:hypothetical protein
LVVEEEVCHPSVLRILGMATEEVVEIAAQETGQGIGQASEAEAEMEAC